MPALRAIETDATATAQRERSDELRAARGLARGVPKRRLWRGGGMMFLVLWAAIVATRWEVIDSPPYYDYAMGLWSEADFLVESGFDYHRLRFEERHTFDPEGGRRSYMTSVMPTVVAALMVTLDDPTRSLMAYHLLVFACTAGVIVGLFGLLMPSGGGHDDSGRVTSWFDRGLACLVCAVVLTTPVFATQVDMASMEMPLVLVAILTLHQVRARRYVLASALSVAGFLVKATGIVLTLALLVQLVLMIWLSRGLPGWRERRGSGGSEGSAGWVDAAQRRRLKRGLLAAVAALTLEWAALQAGGSFAEQVHPVSGSFWFLCQYWFPDLLFVSVAGVLLGGLWAAAWLRAQVSAMATDANGMSWGRKARRVLWRAADRQPHLLLAAVVVGGMIAAFQVVFFVPRYVALLVPLGYLLVGSYFLAAPPRRSAPALKRLAAVAALSGLCVWNVANWNGRFYLDHRAAQQLIYGPFGVWLGREHSHYERSHEYLAEHRSNMRAVKLLEQSAGDEPVFVPHPFNYFATLPRLGYVKRPVRGFSTVGYANAPQALVDAERLLQERPDEAIFVWVANGFNLALSKFRIPLPEAGDEILYHDGMSTPLIVYRKRFAASDDEANKTKRWWYLSRLWPNVPYWVRIGRFLRHDQVDHALTELYLRPEPRPHLGMLYAALLAELGRTDEATSQLLRSLRELRPGMPMYGEAIGPDGPVAKEADTLGPEEAFARGVRLLEADRVDAALPWFLAAAELRLPSVHRAAMAYRRGRWAIDRGAIDEAGTWFETAVRARDDLAAAHHGLGVIRSMRGERDKAEESFRRAIQRDAEYADPHLGLGIVLARSGRLNAAEREFRRAIELEPHLPLAKVYLQRVQRLVGSRVTRTPRGVGQTVESAVARTPCDVARAGGIGARRTGKSRTARAAGIAAAMDRPACAELRRGWHWGDCRTMIEGPQVGPTGG